MRNFTYYAPTKVVFGKGAELQAATEIKAGGYKKILVHFGGKSAKASGLLDRVLKTLDDEELSYITLGGVVPNPLLSLVHKGVELCRNEHVDYILAIGGGSVIDSAKAISVGVPYKGDVWDIFLRTATPKSALPVSAIVTMAAAGSEMSDSMVITNEDGLLKRGVNNNILRCKAAFMNPELTYTLPPYQTASGCVDILMHTLERYFIGGTMQLTDEIAEGIMRTVIRNARILMDEPHNYDARAEILWASSVSHNGLTECGSVKDFSCHALEHELSGKYDVAHGAGLAAVWPSWARYVYKDIPARFAHFAQSVMGVRKGNDDADTALKGIEAMEQFFRDLKMPVRISDMGITLDEELIKELAYKCSYGKTRKVGALKVLDVKEMEDIYRLAL